MRKTIDAEDTKQRFCQVAKSEHAGTALFIKVAANCELAALHLDHGLMVSYVSL